MRKFLVLAILSLSLVSCGYQLRGTGSNLPPNIKRVEIPMFKNMTTRFELDLKLTQGVIDELVARGKFQITSDSKNADAILIGEILSFTVNPIAFSNQTSADRYNIIIVTKITLRDLSNQKVIFSNPNFVYMEEYGVPAGTSYETWETQAITQVAEKFARSLVSTLLEGF
jgi:outer membrane lipopolysaccharide assembly protein LptE/RlpB